jgi:hypothetical protein
MTMSAVQQASQSLLLIVIMSVGIGSLVAYGMDDWFLGNTAKYVLQGLSATLLLVAVVLQARRVCGLIR